MSKTLINVGTGPDAGDGDPLRTAMIACNSNFSELYNPEGEIYAPGYSPFPLCESNQASVGSSKNCYSVAVADSDCIFNRCKVYVDFVNYENDPVLQVAVYEGDSGNLVDGIQGFMDGAPFQQNLTLKGLFTTTFENNNKGIVELVPDVANGAPVGSKIEKGKNLLIVTSINNWVALHGKYLGFPPPSGLSAQASFDPLTNETNMNQQLKSAGLSDLEGMPSCQFYQSYDASPESPEPSPEPTPEPEG